jgi:hypothetical protein
MHWLTRSTCSLRSMTCSGCGSALSGRQRKWCSEQCSKDGARAVRLAQVFNITPEDYDKILAHQDGKCGICRRLPKPGKRLAVDHDHQTGFVRGLLCFMCNKRVLGARSAEVLVKTAAYVTDPPARKALGRDVVAPGRPKKKRKPRRTPQRRKAKP